MKDTNNDYWETVKGAVGAIILLCLLVMFFTCSGCKFFKQLEKTKSDSVNVSKTSEVTSKIDSAGSKTDKTNTKETVYYPQPIYIQGKDGETKVVFVPQTVKETAQDKTEQSQVIKDESWRTAFDSLKVLILSKQSETNGKVGLGFWEIFAICVVGGIFLYVVGNKIITFKK